MSHSKHGIVIFDTRYGNTEKIARALATGLGRAGVETNCVNVKEFTNFQSLQDYDLIAVGTPTEWLTASKPMKAFLENLGKIEISGKFGFAFDTKLSRPLSGSAAKPVEKELKRDGFELIAPFESAIVYGTGTSMSSMTLKEGEEKKFEQIGIQVGGALLKARVEVMH